MVLLKGPNLAFGGRGIPSAGAEMLQCRKSLADECARDLLEAIARHLSRELRSDSYLCPDLVVDFLRDRNARRTILVGIRRDLRRKTGLSRSAIGYAQNALLEQSEM